MKIKRHKKAQRILSFFRNNFGHRPPYQILIDGTFCHACLEMKVNIREQLSKYLGETKPLTTQCCILEMDKLVSMDGSLFGASMILKQFATHRCGHENDSKPAAKCIRDMLGEKNPARYLVATQDQSLREKARRVPGTPVLYLHRSAPTLENPSEMSADVASHDASHRMEASFHSQSLEVLKKKELGTSEETATSRRKRKRTGPNPLSCLKSKKVKKASVEQGQEDATTEGKTKRKRARRRRPAKTATTSSGDVTLN